MSHGKGVDLCYNDSKQEGVRSRIHEIQQTSHEQCLKDDSDGHCENDKGFIFLEKLHLNPIHSTIQPKP